MERSLLCWLRCPFCGGNFAASQTHSGEGELEYGVLTCYCGRWPVVAGIPVFKKDSLRDHVIALIETGRHQDALLSLVSTPSPAPARGWRSSISLTEIKSRLRRVVDRKNNRMELDWSEQAAALLNQREQLTAHDLMSAYFGDKKDNYDYFFFRFAQPRYLVTLSFASIISHPRKPLLDLACGCGHITRSLVLIADDQPVIGADRFFFGLYVAKHWLAPRAQYVCCDVDLSLPFSDGAFAAALCSDAFHYFLNKRTCVRELERLTSDDGLFILVWVHNANVRLPHDGLPLPPEGYRALAAHIPHRLVADSDVLARYLQKQGPPLGHPADLARLAHEPLLSLVASPRKEIFEDYGAFQNWPHAGGNLGLNPLYAETESDRSGHLCLRRTFPSAFFEEEHARCKQYLPETVQVSLDTIKDLKSGRRTPEIERLIEHCVVVGIPERYR